MDHPEKILGIARSDLERLLGAPLPAGFIRGGDRLLPPILEAATLRVRGEVEDDPAWKQVIPYVALAVPVPEPGHDLVFVYGRGRAGSEARLHARRSLGLGGHVEEADFARGVTPKAGYAVAVARELAEEVRVQPPRVLMVGPPIGLINDDSDPVGRVHLGVFHRITLDVFDGTVPVVRGRDAAVADPGWVSTGLLPTLADQFEGWSRAVIDALWPPGH